MTDPSSAADPGPCPASVPDPAVLDSASTPANGHHPNQADTFDMEQQMKIGEPEDNGTSLGLNTFDRDFMGLFAWKNTYTGEPGACCHTLTPVNISQGGFISETGLLESSMRLKPHEAQNYRKKALWVSWVSIVVTMILAIAAFTVSIMRHSASAFGFAFDAILDVLSSIIVIWRYSNAAAVHSYNNVSLFLFLQDDFLYSVSVISGVVCAILSVCKFMLGKVLTSRALITDGFNSLVGAVMGFSILISAEVFKHEPSVWYLDGTIGVLIGLIILAYGVKLLKDMAPRVRQTRHYERFE
uniref:Transmembrane protein 163b n=1 Tax=Cyprinus carpio TaxID=7962 RepID=A0A8C1INS0_CYPCA